MFLFVGLLAAGLGSIAAFLALLLDVDKSHSWVQYSDSMQCGSGGRIKLRCHFEKNMETNLCLPLKIPICYIGLGRARCWSYVLVFDLATSGAAIRVPVCVCAGSFRARCQKKLH